MNRRPSKAGAAAGREQARWVRPEPPQPRGQLKTACTAVLNASRWPPARMGGSGAGSRAPSGLLPACRRGALALKLELPDTDTGFDPEISEIKINSLLKSLDNTHSRWASESDNWLAAREPPCVE